MKELLLFSLLLLANVATAQNIPVGENSSDIEDATFNKAIIHFIDGTDIEGIGKLDKVLMSQDEVIIFKIEEKDKDEKWTVKDVKGITFIKNDGVTHYEYLKVTKNSFPKLYEVVTEGNVTLYKKRKILRFTGSSNSSTTTTTYTNVPVGKSGMTMSMPHTNFIPGSNLISEEEDGDESFSFYVKRENEAYPTKIKDNYIKSFSEYMKDCDEMIQKIKDHEYDSTQFEDLVDYYNANCG